MGDIPPAVQIDEVSPTQRESKCLRQITQSVCRYRSQLPRNGTPRQTNVLANQNSSLPAVCNRIPHKTSMSIIDNQ